MTRVKICGITSAADRDVAITAGADALGFTVAIPVESPREISLEQAIALMDGVPPFVTTVLVSMPSSADEAIRLVERTRVDVLQIHGSLTRSELDSIISETGVKLVQAVDVSDSIQASTYAEVADAILVDSTREAGAGGTGETHDWVEARTLNQSLETPVILAGGLTPDNVTTAVRTVEPYGVDVASGVERTGGRKDHEKVAAFISNAKQKPETAKR